MVTVTETGYPYVECDRTPGKPEPGYLVCEHTEKPQDVGYFEGATALELGIICCGRCKERYLGADVRFVCFHFHVHCAACLRREGLLNDKQLIN